MPSPPRARSGARRRSRARPGLQRAAALGRDPERERDAQPEPGETGEDVGDGRLRPRGHAAAHGAGGGSGPRGAVSRRGVSTESLARTPELRDRLFTLRRDRSRQIASLAARFAAKEAMAKALGAPGNMHWHDAEVVSERFGRPVMTIRGTVPALATELGVTSCHLSLSHDAGIASAVVMLEGAPRTASEPQRVRRGEGGGGRGGGARRTSDAVTRPGGPRPGPAPRRLSRQILD